MKNKLCIIISLSIALFGIRLEGGDSWRSYSGGKSSYSPKYKTYQPKKYGRTRKERLREDKKLNPIQSQNRYNQYDRYHQNPYYYNYRYLPHHHQPRYNKSYGRYWMRGPRYQ